MTIRYILGTAAMAVAILAASIVPALAGLGQTAPAVGDSTPGPIVLIDTGVVVSEDGQSAISAYSVSLGDN
jgi:hypothetical protein